MDPLVLMQTTYLFENLELRQMLRQSGGSVFPLVVLVRDRLKADDALDELPVLGDPGSNGPREREDHRARCPGVFGHRNLGLNGLHGWLESGCEELT